MSRLVQSKPKVPEGAADLASADKTPGEKVKEYGERVAKYVPAEIVAFYSSAVQFILIKDAPEDATFRLWASGISALIAWIAVPIWLARFEADPTAKRWNQVIAFFAFAVWAYAYPAGWFKEMNLHDPVYAGLALLAFSFVSGFAQPRV